MSFRKIIKFGESSHIVSIPSEFMKKHKLQKGATVRLEEAEDHLKIFPNIEPKHEEPKTTSIKFQNISQLNLQLVSAYLNNYKKIIIAGEISSDELDKVREIVQDFVALEIIQQSPGQIVLMDYLNSNDISVQDTIRRIDRTLMAMMEDTEKEFTNPNQQIASIKSREANINKLSLLVFKILKRYMGAPVKQTDVPLSEMHHYWEIALFLEKIADQVKRIPLHINAKNKDATLILYKNICEYYKKVMHAHYKKDMQEARKLILEKKDIFQKLEKSRIENGTVLVEKLKNMIYQSCSIMDSMIKTEV